MNELVHRYSYIINSTHRSRQTGRARNVRGEPRYLSAGKGRTHVAITGRSLPLSRLMRQCDQLSCKLTIEATHSSVSSASRSQWMYHFQAVNRIFVGCQYFGAQSGKDFSLASVISLAFFQTRRFAAVLKQVNMWEDSSSACSRLTICTILAMET